MATSQLVWTILPYGATGAPGERGTRRRVSVAVSPRLTPESVDEPILGKFPASLKWPDVLGGAKFSAISGGKQIGLELISKIDPDLWREFFTEETPVAGFQYMDMSAVNLRSYSVRNMLGYVKRHYGKPVSYTHLDVYKRQALFRANDKRGLLVAVVAKVKKNLSLIHI